MRYPFCNPDGYSSSCKAKAVELNDDVFIIKAFIAHLAGAVVQSTSTPAKDPTIPADEDHAIDNHPVAIPLADGVGSAPPSGDPAVAKTANTPEDEEVATQGSCSVAAEGAAHWPGNPLQGPNEPRTFGSAGAFNLLTKLSVPGASHQAWLSTGDANFGNLLAAPNDQPTSLYLQPHHGQ
ncbi:hypothetical protein L7F22_059509 [Adiantum nelumboides]|nr:hypothetical protein [Adiantum nelumboides]